MALEVATVPTEIDAIENDEVLVEAFTNAYYYFGSSADQTFEESDWDNATVSPTTYRLLVSGTINAVLIDSNNTSSSWNIRKELITTSYGVNHIHCDYFIYRTLNDRTGVWSSSAGRLYFFTVVGGTYTEYTLESGYEVPLNHRAVYNVDHKSDASIFVQWEIYDESDSLTKSGDITVLNGWNPAIDYYVYNRAYTNSQEWICVKVITVAITWEKDIGSGFVEIGTGFTLLYTALLPDNGGSIRAKAVAGAETAYSELIPLTITPAFVGDLRAESKKTVRRPLAKVKITWTDPLIDVSLNMITSESNRISYPEQVADLVTDVPRKWFHTNDPDSGTNSGFYPAPSTLLEARKSQMGWWGTQNAGVSGEFPDPNKPTLQVNFTKRLVERFTITGDNALNEFPVDFTVTVFLYVGGSYIPIERMDIVGNTEMSFSAEFATAHTTAARLQLEVSKWSSPGKVVKIVEFYSNITEIYESDDIMLLNILQEFESSEGTLPVGNISCNEMDLTLQNITDMFFPQNTDSPIHTMIKRNRKIEPFLGFQYATGEIEFLAKGLYWSGDWMVSDNSTGASTTARDRFELLRKKEFPWETVFTEILSDVSLKTLFEAVMESAFDYMYDFYYDLSDLDDSIVVPHFEPEFFKGKSYFDVIKDLSAASFAYSFMDLPTAEEIETNGPLNKDVLRVKRVETVFPQKTETALAIDITKDDFIDKMQPADTESMANSITVTYKIYQPDPEEPGEWVDEEFTYLGTDEDSIIEYGVMDYSYESSDLIQTETHAKAIADSLLTSFTISNRNIELQTYGDITLELANQISVPEYQKRDINKWGVFAITALNSQYDGSLRIGVSARKIEDDRSKIVYKTIQDTDSSVELLQDTDDSLIIYQDTGA